MTEAPQKAAVRDEREMRGVSGAIGVAVGRAFVVQTGQAAPVAPSGDVAAEQQRALGALAQVGNELARAADMLRRLGQADEAEILDANRLMAGDPVLADEVRSRAATSSAVTAVLEATEHHAGLLEGLGDPLFASRAADVRRLGQRAADLLTGRTMLAGLAHGTILVARDLGPADVAEIAEAGGRVLGIALSEGAVTSHAAIMARALGVPMVVALGSDLLTTAEGEELALDGDEGTLILRPAPADRLRARAAALDHAKRQQPVPASEAPLTTVDGRAISLLCNASTRVEVAAGLAAGAEGAGLVRTELAFVDARAWPDELECSLALEPVLSALADRPATVRIFDFGGDKTPPFLAGTALRGTELMLEHEQHLAAQLMALLRVGGGTRLRLLAPLVEHAGQVQALRRLLGECADRAGFVGALPAIGAMIETPSAVERIDEIAEAADFLSIGTNDLVHFALGLDRSSPAAAAGAAADPRVLRLVAQVGRAAEQAGLRLEVCGEAVGEPGLAALFIGLGVHELSVAPVRLAAVRALILALSVADATSAAARALEAPDADQVARIADELHR